MVISGADLGLIVHSFEEKKVTELVPGMNTGEIVEAKSALKELGVTLSVPSSHLMMVFNRLCLLKKDDHPLFPQSHFQVMLIFIYPCAAHAQVHS